MRRLTNQKPPGSTLDISILACSKGAEVYSILWTIRRARPDLEIRTRAVDISQEILSFAEKGVYSFSNLAGFDGPGPPEENDVIRNTRRDQQSSMFERMTAEEMQAMFDIEGEEAKVKTWLKDGITWLLGDAGDPQLAASLGPQDIVVANRFLCHMEPVAAERTLRNISHMVKPGGYLFVSGVDLDVRTRVASEMKWTPVTDLMREIHDGDVSLRRGWPTDYWGLEPFSDKRPLWKIRYASAFQIGASA